MGAGALVVAGGAYDAAPAADLSRRLEAKRGGFWARARLGLYVLHDLH